MIDKDIKTLDEIKKEAQPDFEILSLRRQVDGLKQEVKTLQADYGDLKGYFRDLQAVAGNLAIAAQPQVYVPKEKSSKSSCVAVLHLTDWHYGAIQQPVEIDNVNEFSPEILEARIRNLVKDFVRWITVLRSAYRIDDLCILDTGDNISGDIHRELSITNAFPTPVQAFRCGVFKGEVFSSLAPHFNKINIEFLTPDNHGRLTTKPQSKQEGLNTHNYVVGHVAQLVSCNQKNINFKIHTQHSTAIQVGNRNYLISHGHGVMGWAGFPYYGIERKVAKEALARLHQPATQRFHKVILGHWHAPLKHPIYWIGGSASGTDAYDHKQGRRSEPIQCAWIVHPVHREFNQTDFLLRS